MLLVINLVSPLHRLVSIYINIFLFKYCHSRLIVYILAYSCLFLAIVV